MTDMPPLMSNYNRLPIAFEYGKGVWLYDSKNQPYLDAIGGIAVCALGHAHPAISTTLYEQASKIIHSSNLFEIKNQQLLAQKLIDISGSDAVFFCNSGAEANEAAIKLTRLYAHHEKQCAEPLIAVMKNAFHGRTMATWTASDPREDSPFAPLLPGFIQTEFGDIDQLQQLVAQNPECCAVMLEPIQGEAGIRIPPRGYLHKVRELCNKHGLLMLIDEVQSGVARTGNWYCFQHEAVQPDIITSAKALANGVPIGACIAKKAVAKYFTAGMHGSTFGGNPLACAVGLAVIDCIEQQNLIQHSKEIGDYLLTNLKDTLTHPIVKDIRGKGLMIGIELDVPCKQLPRIALDKKLLINVTTDYVIRLLPPLILQQNEADIMITRIKQVLDKFEETI